MSQAIALCVQIRSPNVPTPSGFSVQAGSQDSVVQLKQLIQQEHPRRPPYRQMRLFYQGRELLDGDTLDQYIRDADAPVTVHMFVAAWVPPPSPLPQPSTEKVPPAVADPARGMLPPPRLGQDQQQKQSTPKTNGEYDAVPRGQAQLTHASNSSPQFHRHDSREIKGGQDIPAAQRPDHLPRQPPAVSIISLGHAFQYVLINNVPYLIQMPPITSSIHGPGPAGLSRYILPGIQQPFGGVMSRRGSHPASMYVANSGHSGSALAAAIAAARQAAAGPAGYSMTDQSARPTLRPAATDIRDHGNQDRFGPENEDTADVQPRRFEARMEFELNLNLNAMWSILWLLIRMALFVAIFAQDASWERLALLAALAIGFFLLRTRRVPGLLRGVGADNGRAARRQQPIPGATLGNNPNNNNNDNNEPQPPLTIWHKVRTFFVALISTLVPGEPFTVPVNENE